MSGLDWLDRVDVCKKTLPLSPFHCVFAFHPTESFHLPCGKAILNRLNPMLSFTPRDHPHNMDFQESIANCNMLFFFDALGAILFFTCALIWPLEIWNSEFGTFEKTRWQPITHILEQKDAICFYTSLAALRLTMPSQPIAPVAPSMQWWLAARFQLMFGCNWSQLVLDVFFCARVGIG